MTSRRHPTPSLQALVFCVGVSVLLAAPSWSGDDPERDAPPPPSPKPILTNDEVLFSDTFSSPRLKGWKADRDGVWSIRGGVLRADLPDNRQEHSFLYAGSADWTDYAVDLDVCAMRGADKGVAVRVAEGASGIGVDLRGPGYQDVIINRREWPMGKARAINGNTIWHHLRVEARGHRYRVFVNGNLLIDKLDSKRSRERGGIALAAYTGGVAQCTVYYDNVLVTSLGEEKAAKATN